MKRIDPQTSAKIHHILLLCRQRGQDPVGALDAAGFLRHQAAKDRDAVNLLDHGIIPGVRNIRIPPDIKTPLDTKRFIIEALEGLRDQCQAAQ
jgi:hypothetical protein